MPARTLEEIFRNVAELQDPNAAWQLVWRAAKRANTSVRIELEYHAPSIHAGRRILLIYNAGSDEPTWKWLDN